MNCEGKCVERPDSDTNDMTAKCRDGTDSHSRHRTGTCSGHGGVLEWNADPSVTIGSHTVSHPILLRHDSTYAACEIKESKSIIESQLGRPVRHLAFPFGDRGSVGPREFLLARDAGYLTAVTTRPGHLWTRHARQLTALPRVSINGNFQSEAAVHALLSGVPFLAWPTDSKGPLGA
jgi:peptidoglycan/xylan/chitin deacetylase (PgdA/CDA1 family)